MRRGDIDGEALVALPGARRCPLLSDLAAPELDVLLHDARVSHHERRDPPTTVPGRDDALRVVLRGALFELVRRPGGGGTYGHPVAPGATIGLTDVLLADPFEREACALLSSTVLWIPGDTLRALTASRDLAALAVATTGLQLLRAAEDDRVVLSYGDATDRVLRRVADLVERWGRPTDRGIDITLPLTQEQLAVWSGSSRETTVRVLRRLRAQGLVETSRRHLRVVDPAAVVALARSRGVAVGTPGRREPGRPGPRCPTWPAPLR